MHPLYAFVLHANITSHCTAVAVLKYTYKIAGLLSRPLGTHADMLQIAMPEAQYAQGCCLGFRLAGSDAVEYSLRSKGYNFGSCEVDIIHQGQIIGHVSTTLTPLI